MNKRIAGKTLALSATLVLAATPSREAGAVGVGDVVSGVTTAYGAYEKYLGNQLTLEQATAQVVTAINSARTEIISRIEGIAAADAKACAKAAVIDFQTIQVMSELDKSLLASRALVCLTTIESYLETFQTKAAVDKLGFALNALGPIVLMSRAAANIPVVPDITDTIVNSNNIIIGELAPSCNSTRVGIPEEGEPQLLNVRCAAYNGDSGSVLTWSGDPERSAKLRGAQTQAARNTSRPLAQRANAVIPTP